jgi:hypothetical protein
MTAALQIAVRVEGDRDATRWTWIGGHVGGACEPGDASPGLSGVLVALVVTGTALLPVAAPGEAATHPSADVVATGRALPETSLIAGVMR